LYSQTFDKHSIYFKYNVPDIHVASAIVLAMFSFCSSSVRAYLQILISDLCAERVMIRWASNPSSKIIEIALKQWFVCDVLSPISKDIFFFHFISQSMFPHRNLITPDWRSWAGNVFLWTLKKRITIFL
jgi:hypothetical protein